MSKLLLMSAMIAIIVFPARAARATSAHAGLKKALLQLLCYQAFYAFALIYLWGRC